MDNPNDEKMIIDIETNTSNLTNDEAIYAESNPSTRQKEIISL